MLEDIFNAEYEFVYWYDNKSRWEELDTYVYFGGGSSTDGSYYYCEQSASKSNGAWTYKFKPTSYTSELGQYLDGDGYCYMNSKQNIPYSAVVRKNDTVAITVSKENAQAYKQIESAVKGERAVELVNAELFKALPKQERFTRRMDEGQARKKSAELTAKGVEHSAVFGGEKSAVTVAKKDSKRAFFSRDKMQRDAQRISGRGQQNPQQVQQTPKKRNNQGLE